MIAMGLVDWIDGFNTLDFNNHLVLDHEVDPIAKINLLALVNDRQSNLAGDPHFLLPKLMQQASLVTALKQPRTEHRVHFHSSSHNLAGVGLTRRVSWGGAAAICIRMAITVR